MKPLLLVQSNLKPILQTTNFRQCLSLEKRRKQERSSDQLEFYLENINDLLSDRVQLIHEGILYGKVTRNELARDFYDRYLGLIEPASPEPQSETPIPLFTSEYLSEVDQKLLDEKWIARSDARAEYIYFEKYLILERILEKLYRKIVASNYERIRFSLLTVWESLMKTSLPKTLLHEFYFYSKIKSRTPSYSEMFRKRAYLKGEMNPLQLQSYTDAPKGIINFSSCNGLWAGIEKTNYSSDLVRYYDCDTPSLRYEGQATRSLMRLDSFRRFEAVFIGSEELVKKEKESLELKLDEFLKLLNILTRKLQTTPWDATSDRRRLTTDWEVPLAANIALEVGNLSFNDRVYTKAFQIKCKNEPAYSGCSGFGIQRLIYCFLCCNGFDPSRWPTAIKELLNSENSWPDTN